MVGSAVVQEVVSGAFSLMRNNHEEMASQTHLIERLKLAHLNLKFALERTKRMPIIEVSLLELRMMLKHAFEESRDFLCKQRTLLVNLEGEGAEEQGVTLSISLPNRIMHAVKPFFGTEKGSLSGSCVRRFEMFAQKTGKFSSPLITQLLEGKYVLYEMVGEAQLPRCQPACGHPAWKCFQSLIPLYHSITRIEPRDGRSTSLWHDAWTPLGPLSVALPAAFSHCLRPLATVADALRSGAVEVPLVHRVSATAAGEMEFIHACLSRISLTSSPDIRSVSLGPLTDFSTGSVYRSLHSSGCIVPGQDVNWTCFAPLKVRVFFWILRLRKTRTRVLLHRIGCVPSPNCPFCPNQLEDTSHLFVGCPRLRPLWNIVSPSGRPHVDADVSTLLDALSEDLPPMHPEARNTVVLALLWTVWKSRNRMVFDADFMSTPRILAMLVDHLRLWVVRAPSRVDTTALLAWCQAIS
ncbi:hypothetical protein ACQ4PT_000902 [Festuca glaucescens]